MGWYVSMRTRVGHRRGREGSRAHLGGSQKRVPRHEGSKRSAERIGASKGGGAPPVGAAAQGGAGLGEHKVQHAAGGEEVHAAAEGAQRDPVAHL